MPQRLRIALCLSALLALSGTAAADAVFIWPDGSGDYATIQEAVLDVPDGSTVYLIPGTFTGPGNRDITWSGKNVSVVVFGAQGSAIIDCEGEDRAMRLRSGVDSTSVISGLTFTNGYPANGSGGAIDCENAGPSIQDCTFTFNSATYGGAIRFQGGPAPRVEGCVFHDNESVYGGAIDASDCDLRVRQCTFVDNVASRGGAVQLNGCTAVFERATMCRNSADYGAALRMVSSSALLDQCIVAFNMTNEALTGEETSEICYTYIFANCDGDDVEGNAHDNEVADPQLCDLDGGDAHPCADSRCLPSQNAWGLHIGHLAAGCGACSSPVRNTSWGAIKSLYR